MTELRPRRKSESWASSAAIRKTMLGCRSRDTAPELALRSAVHRLGLRYRVSTRPISAVRRTADMVFASEKVAVMLDGCFWHQCPRHYVPPLTNAPYWEGKIAGNVARDRDTDRCLSEAGWKVLRVWECEDVNDAALRIWDVIWGRRTPSRGPGLPNVSPAAK
jgi:DNA mismatch endonuclease (patch repair protein)